MKINNKILILTVVLIPVFFLGCIGNDTQQHKYSGKVGGINVYSDIPFSEVENWDEVSLFHKNNTAIKRCNLEISSVSQSNYKGPEINIEQSDKPGIYIHKNSAEIKGRNDAERSLWDS